MGIVVGGGCVLVGRRRRPPLAGFAEFPGGKARAGEKAEAALAREVREETGLSVRPQALVSRSRVTYPHGTLDLHFFLCRVDETPDAELERPRPPFRWLSLDRIASLRFPPANAAVLRWLAACDTDPIAPVGAAAPGTPSTA